ncbi:hypothetical protein EJK51_0203 [Moraxella catarrhalis]|nr:hypothetical protein EJK52_0204 [Moraxella catarrhalis]AZQ90861.1 hypothetical protein EJK51_0203 [Moraxella catarrhalis]
MHELSLKIGQISKTGERQKQLANQAAKFLPKYFNNIYCNKLH